MSDSIVKFRTTYSGKEGSLLDEQIVYFNFEMFCLRFMVTRVRRSNESY